MGCEQITPGMVGLAKKLQGKPFHIIASYCQRGSKEQAVASLEKEGWSDKMTNLTVMDQTRFPKAPVKYVPYYLLFDHTGKLQHNHMAGPYHGGDGDNYQKLIKALLKKVPKEEKAKATEPSGQLSTMRPWTNVDGKTIKARVLEVKESTVRLQVANGRIHTYDLDKLSDESRAEIKRLVEAKNEAKK